jgi:hypothetical protein
MMALIVKPIAMALAAEAGRVAAVYLRKALSQKMKTWTTR